jgi:hypothetical protein
MASLMVLAAHDASAQSTAVPRGGQGLFGAVRPDTSQTRLDFTFVLAEGYDDDVPTSLSQSIDSNSLQSGGFTTIFGATTTYSWTGRRVDVVGNGAANVRHYQEAGVTRSTGHNGGLGLRVRTGRASFLVNEAVAYMPTYMYDLFPTGAQLQPGSTAANAPDYAVNERESYAYTTSFSTVYEFTTRSRATATADYTFNDRRREAVLWEDSQVRGLRGDYAYNLGPNTAMLIQYRYRDGNFGYGDGPDTTEHGVDFGMNYVKPLSATRRVSFNFKVGTSSADIPELTLTGYLLRRQFQGVGEVGFGYEFGRSWQTRTFFRRGLEYVVDLPEPVFADGFSTSLAGLLSRRVDVMAVAGFSRGASLINRNSLNFDTYTGDVRVRVAIGRTWATYFDYLYYYYDFSGNAVLAPGIPRGLERNGVRAGLTLWVPALRR